MRSYCGKNSDIEANRRQGKELRRLVPAFASGGQNFLAIGANGYGKAARIERFFQRKIENVQKRVVNRSLLCNSALE